MPLPTNFEPRSFRDAMHALHWGVCSCFLFPKETDGPKSGVLQFHWQVGGWESDYGSAEDLRLSFTVMPTEDLELAALADPQGEGALSPQLIAGLSGAVKPFGMSVRRSLVDRVEVGDGAFQRAAIRVRVEFGIDPLPEEHPTAADDAGTPF